MSQRVGIPLIPGRTIGVGLVGAGKIAELHALAIRSAGAELRGIVSSLPDRTLEAAERLGVPEVFESVVALARDPAIDVIHITSPNGLHVDHVSAAIDAGVHVVCEKPLATTAAAARELVRSAAVAGIVGTVAFTYRLHPAVLEARARIQAGEIGPIQMMQGHFLQDWVLNADPSEWRLDSTRGGPSRTWADIGSHLVDLLEFVSGDRVKSVAATHRRTVISTSSDSVSEDDAVTATATTRHGAIASLVASQVAPGHGNNLAIELNGQKASIAVDFMHSERIRLGADGSFAHLRGTELSAGRDQAGFEPEGGLPDFIAGFCAFVEGSYRVMAGNSSEQIATLSDGLRAAYVTDAILQASQTRQWADVMSG